MTAMKCETLKLYDRHVYDGCENVTLDIMIRTRAPRDADTAPTGNARFRRRRICICFRA